MSLSRLVAGIGLTVYAGAVGALALYAGPGIAGGSVILATGWKLRTTV